MRLINKSSEPDCLTKLKRKKENSYSDLKGDCKEEVSDLLFSDQNGLCAYCERELKVNVFIEHYLPQEAEPEKNLDYSNFLGVCSGKYYIDRKKGTKIDFCSVKRGSETLTVNPELPAHIDDLFFDENNKIRSKSKVIDKELEDVLNLNFDDLCLDREISFEDFIEPIKDFALEQGQPKKVVFEKAIKIIRDKPSEFSSFIIYGLNQFLNNL